MNILLLAPHPIYQERGTPIAVNLILRVLSERKEHVDVVTYHEGREVTYGNVKIYRIQNIPFIHHIQPGFSWKKVICDFFMFIKVSQLVLKKRYQLVHAVEESVFIALMLKKLFKIPYVYDMDSSLAEQMVEKYPSLALFGFLFRFFERSAVRNAKAVMPVCDALASIIGKYKPEKIVILRDVSLLECVDCKSNDNLKAELGVQGLVLMYVGNLAVYQGIDLLLESFALAINKPVRVDLVIIGGDASDIQKYKRKSHNLGIHQKVHFLGPKPTEYLAGYLSEADILVSPRIKGKNTPMKLYSYLHSGKAVLATNLETHTQVLDNRVAILVDPSAETFAQGMLYLIENERLREELGMAGKKLVEEKFSYSTFRINLNNLFDWIKMEMDRENGISTYSDNQFSNR